MLVADPTDHADREGPASRACEAVAVEQRDDLIVIMRGCQGADVSNEGIGITNRFGAVRRKAQLDRFDGTALPANIQSQQLWIRRKPVAARTPERQPQRPPSKNISKRIPSRSAFRFFALMPDVRSTNLSMKRSAAARTACW